MLWLQPYEPGSLAVLTFFVMSGFIITEAADRQYIGRPAPFIYNRCLRIIPHFSIALLLSIAIQCALDQVGLLRIERQLTSLTNEALTFQNFFSNFLTLIPFFNKSITYNFIPISWALRVELIFYLLITLALICTKKFSLDRILAFIAGFMSILFLIFVIFKKGPNSIGFLPYFILGSSLYFYLKKQSKFIVLIILASLIGIYLHFMNLPLFHPSLGFRRNFTSQFFILLFLLTIFILTTKISLNKGILKNVDAWLGRLTYPLYLYHYVILILFSFFPLGMTSFYLAIISSIIFSMLLSYILDPVFDRYRDSISEIFCNHNINIRIGFAVLF